MVDLSSQQAHTASISTPRDEDPGTCTDASEDRTGVFCLWADVPNVYVQFPILCPLGKSCCLVRDEFWQTTRSEDS